MVKYFLRCPILRQKQAFLAVEGCPFKGEELATLETQVSGWDVIEAHHITKTFKFPDFREALKFVNHVGELAEEQQGHHLDISLAWGKDGITTWTHKIMPNGERFHLGSQNRPTLQALNSALCVNLPMAARIACFFVQSQKPAVRL